MRPSGSTTRCCPWSAIDKDYSERRGGRVGRLRALWRRPRRAGHAPPARRVRGRVPGHGRHGSGARAPRRATRATASPARGRSTPRTTTARSSSTPTATASRPFTASASARDRSATCGSASRTSAQRARFYELIAPWSGHPLDHRARRLRALQRHGHVVLARRRRSAYGAPAPGVRRQRQSRRAGVPPRRGRGRLPRQRPGRRAGRVPRGLLRRLRPRPGREQHRGGEPQSLRRRASSAARPASGRSATAGSSSTRAT